MTYYVSSGTLNLTKPKPKPNHSTKYRLLFLVRQKIFGIEASQSKMVRPIVE